jgi:hypothetical protein
VIDARGAIFALVGALGLLGCEEQSEARAYPVSIVIQSDPGKAVAGAAILQANKTLGTSDVGGVVRLDLKGQDGDSVDLILRCPNGYESPKKAITVRLGRLGDAQRLPEYSATCAPAIRHVVVSIRADSGPNLPITYLGREVSRTDASGAGHILMRMRPGDQFELGLDTTGYPKHRPQNPKASFLVPSTGDEVMRFDVRFDVERPKPIARAAPQRPKRL